MAQAISICNQKGGVGKSTTAVNISAYLALSGNKTLLIDLDPQGNSTTSCGIQRSGLTQSTYSALVNNVPIENALLKTSVDRLELLPSTLDLAGAEPYLTNAENRETVLKRICEPLKTRYDFILLDCPPSLGLLTINALVAADSTIIPVQCEYFALEGLRSLTQLVNMVKQKLNPDLQIRGILLTMTDFRATLSREVAGEVRKFFKDLVFDTAIPRNVRLAESPSFGKPICLYDPNCTGALAYKLLTQELLSRLKDGQE